MKKTTTIIVIVLILIMYFQLIYYTRKNNSNTLNEISENYTNTTNTTSTENKVIAKNSDAENKQVIPDNLSDFYKSYSGTITMESLKSKLYNFIYEKTAEISNMTSGKSGDEIEQIYNDNTQKINEMYIYSLSDFSEIVNQLNQIKYTSKYEYASSELDLSKISKTAEYTTIKLTVKYNNGHIFTMNLYLANDETTNIKFQIKNYSELDELYQKYNGTVKKSDTEKSINYFINTAANSIQSATDSKTKNQILQYFDLNKDSIEEMNIYSGEDFYNVYTQVIKISWKKNPEFINYKIDMTEYKEQSNYAIVPLIINYSTNQSITLKLYLATNATQQQTIHYSI